MFERYTEKARRVIFFARYEASQFGASQIETEHLLLGLLRENSLLVARHGYDLSVTFDSIRKEIESRSTQRERVPTSVDLPFSDEARRALHIAAEESENLGHRYIGPEHLLLGLFRVEDSLAAQILAERGWRIEEVRESSRGGSKEELRLPLTTLHSHAKWVDVVLEEGLELGLFTAADIAREHQRVLALRQLSSEAEALLHVLVAKGLVEPERVTSLAFELRNEKGLREFLAKLRGGSQKVEG